VGGYFALRDALLVSLLQRVPSKLGPLKGVSLARGGLTGDNTAAFEACLLLLESLLYSSAECLFLVVINEYLKR
jgi:hypothetical protein